MKTAEQKAVEACVDYVRISNEIKRLGREIGNALIDCPGIENQSEGETHLREYYANRSMQEYVGGFNQVKGQAEFEACPHCVLADKLIQERKTARRSLGAVKSRITKIGGAA